MTFSMNDKTRERCEMLIREDLGPLERPRGRRKCTMKERGFIWFSEEANFDLNYLLFDSRPEKRLLSSPPCSDSLCVYQGTLRFSLGIDYSLHQNTVHHRALSEAI